MIDPPGGISIARQSWKIWTYLREWLRSVEQIRKLITDIASLERRVVELEKKVVELEKKIGRDTSARCPSCLKWDTYRALKAGPNPNPNLARLGARVHYMKCD